MFINSLSQNQFFRPVTFDWSGLWVLLVPIWFHLMKCLFFVGRLLATNVEIWTQVVKTSSNSYSGIVNEWKILLIDFFGDERKTSKGWLIQPLPPASNRVNKFLTLTLKTIYHVPFLSHVYISEQLPIRVTFMDLPTASKSILLLLAQTILIGSILSIYYRCALIFSRLTWVDVSEQSNATVTRFPEMALIVQRPAYWHLHCSARDSTVLRHNNSQTLLQHLQTQSRRII